MVALSEVEASNRRISSTFQDGLVAVFVGGTSGIGEYTLKQLAKDSRKLRAYIVGRSQEAADRIIKECMQLNSAGEYIFMKADVSLLKNVDDVCRQIKAKEKAINILFQSQATMATGKVTSEGLPFNVSIILHGRLRFLLNLLPLVQNATALRRVVYVAAATLEGPIDLDNISGEGYTLFQLRDQTASIITLTLQEVARRAPDVAFVHDVPGVVKSGIMRDAPSGFGLKVIMGVARLLSPFINTSPEEAGKAHVFFATSGMYAPRQGENATGVPPVGTVEAARGVDGEKGSGVYSINNKGESASLKVEQLMAEFKANGVADRVWEYLISDFRKVTGTESIN